MNDETSALNGELGAKLFRAGRDEWPSDDALARTLSAIGAGAAVATVAGGAIAAASASAGTAAKGSVVAISAASIAKWLGIGALGGVVVAGVAHQITPSPGTPLAPAAIPAPPAPARGEAKQSDAPKLEPAPTAGTEPEPPKVSEKPQAHAREQGPEDERGVPLAAEVALVDRARAALATGSAGRALDELRAYESSFPEPRLLPEVLFLRMEAYLAAGNAARARETAEQSIRLFPRSPHAARAREVIEGRGDEKK
jgi:TolA-binding protein